MKLTKKQSKIIKDLVTQSEPYKVFTRKKYGKLDGYFDTDKIQYDFALRLLSFQASSKEYLAGHDARYSIFFLLNTFLQRDLKFLWIGEELLKALLQTTPPQSETEVKQVFPCGVLMLPRGVINTPAREIPVDWICFCHFSEDDPDTRSVTLDNGEIIHFKKSDQDCLVWALLARDLEGADVVYIGSAQAKDIYLHDEESHQDEESAFVRQISNLIVSVLLYLQVAPKQKDQALNLKLYNKGFSTSEKSTALLNPYILGADYKQETETSNNPDVSGTRKTIRTHWRKGHCRNQPYKENQEQKYRLVWIKPILINAN